MEEEPKLPTTESSLEKQVSKEAVPQRPVVLVYRNNGLYERMMPTIVEELTQLGHRVELHKLPRETTDYEVEEWMRQKTEEMKLGVEGKDVITDRTVGKLFYNSVFREQKPKDAEFKDFALDDIFNETAAQVILGEELRDSDRNFLEYTPSSKERSRLQAEKAIPKIINGILINAANRPEVVYLIKEQIRDHAPLSELSNDDEAVQKVKEWLIRGGVSEEVFATNRQHKVRVEWVVGDRHVTYGGGVEESADSKKITLSLPLSNLFMNVINNGLLNFNSEDMRKFEDAIKKFVRKQYEPVSSKTRSS